MRRDTIDLLITLALGFLVAPLAAEAQPSGNVPRIGYLRPGSAEPRHLTLSRRASWCR